MVQSRVSARMPPPYHVNGETVPLADYDVGLISLAALLAILTILGIARSLVLNTISSQPPVYPAQPNSETILDNNAAHIQQEHSPDIPVSPVIPISTSNGSDPGSSLVYDRTMSDMASLTSTTTRSSDSESLCSTNPGTQTTSMTSITAVVVDLDEEDEDTEPEDFQYELKRAQTQSMEVQKGVLMSWSTLSAGAFGTKDAFVPDLPSVVISELVSSCQESCNISTQCDPAFLHPPKMGVSLASCPSGNSLQSTASSVNLVDEFPLPPNDTLAQLSIPIILESEAASTLEQVMNMYEDDD